MILDLWFDFWDASAWVPAVTVKGEQKIVLGVVLESSISQSPSIGSIS